MTLSEVQIEKECIKNLFKNYIVISLGYSCIPKLVIRKITSQPTYLFDWIGIDLWSIYQILKDNFPVLTNKTDLFIYDTQKIADKRMNIMTHKKYFIRFLHDYKISDMDNQEICNENTEKYKRRTDRFQQLLCSNDPIIFLHLEENDVSRLETLSKEIRNYYPNSELNYNQNKSKLSLTYASKISNFIRMKYNKNNFYIIIVSRYMKKQYIEIDNIIVLKYNITTPEFKNKDTNKRKLQELLSTEFSYINNIINTNL